MKNNIFFICYRLMEFRLFINSGILNKCSKYFNVIFLVPKDAVNECKKYTSNSITVIASNYPSEKNQNKKKKKNLLLTIENFFRNILALTYAKSSNYEICISQKFQIESYLNSQNNKKLIRYIRIKTVIFIALIASNFFFIRKFIQFILLFFIKNNYHHRLFKEYQPKLVVVGSMGLDADGLSIYEAKINKVKSVVINQSWDRTVCKGYPVIHPDHLIVWNYHMKDEAIHYLDMPPKNIEVKGSPVWDYLFKNENILPKEKFVSQLGFDKNKPIIYYPLSSSFWHKDLLKMIKQFIELRSNNKINKDIQIIFRLHPYYWRDDKLRKELFLELRKLEKIDNYYVDYNKVSTNDDTTFLSPSDQEFLINVYKHSDICISVCSSSMVEMTLLKKPSINLIYGSWVTSKENILIKNFTLHHLVKLYEYDLIKNVYSFSDVLKIINNLKNINFDEIKYNKFLDGEVPVHRGNSSYQYAKTLYLLSESS